MDGLMKTRNIPISMMRKNSVQEIGDKLVTMLDEIEKRVEHLRESAGIMEQEKEALLELLTTVHMNKDMLRLGDGDREDIAATTDRLLTRCKTVQVSVRTPRNDVQERALNSVNDLIDALLNKMKMDVDNSKQEMLRICERAAQKFAGIRRTTQFGAQAVSKANYSGAVGEGDTEHEDEGFADLVSHFSKYGKVENVGLVYVPQYGFSRGTALIHYWQDESAKRALNDPLHHIAGNKISLSRMNPDLEGMEQGRSRFMGRRNRKFTRY